jgi:hypothetical protein
MSPPRLPALDPVNAGLKSPGAPACPITVAFLANPAAVDMRRDL